MESIDSALKDKFSAYYKKFLIEQLKKDSQNLKNVKFNELSPEIKMHIRNFMYEKFDADFSEDEQKKMKDSSFSKLFKLLERDSNGLNQDTTKDIVEKYTPYSSTNKHSNKLGPQPTSQSQPLVFPVSISFRRRAEK